MSYLLLADSHTFLYRAGTIWRLDSWGRQGGYVTAKARRANGYVDRPLRPSEQARLVEDVTQLALH